MGIALRYGLLYGGDANRLRPMLTRLRLPVADGGVLGWTHHQDAAAATVAALERGRPGQAYNVVDDRPASWREMYTAMATAFATPPPYRLPRWLVRMARALRRLVRRGRRAAGLQRQGQGGARLEACVPTYLEGIRATA